MGEGWAQECDSAIELADEVAFKLAVLDPKNDLLKFWFVTPENMTDGKPDPVKEAANQLAMKDKFWDKSRGDWKNVAGSIVTAVVTTNYYLALKSAIATIDDSKLVTG